MDTVVTRVSAFLAVTFLACGSVAARPSTLDMTCDQARATVASEGAVVMSTGQHTYERFVANWGFCNFDEWADWTSAPTRDVRRCPVGYVCKYRPAPWEDF
jgi:hypothetical protein